MRPHLHGRLGPALRRAAEVSAQARATGAPWGEVAQQRTAGHGDREARFNRRTLLKGMTSAGAVAAMGPLSDRARGQGRHRDRTAPRIVIVGGGLAGIRCAHHLWTQRRLASTIYEWDDRLGGRVDTLRGVFANGQMVERWGEFISSEHHSMRRLAARYGLTLGDTSAYPRVTVDTF